MSSDSTTAMREHMREHHACAYARASANRHASAHATDVRTDGLTQMNKLCDVVLRNASHAGGLNAESRIGHGTARRQQSEDPTTRAVAARPASVGVFAFGGGTEFAQGYAARPQPKRMASGSASSPLTRRRAVIIGCPSTPRDSLAACSPVARWHGRSDGSDPLRPSRELTADRCKETIALCPESYRNHPVQLWIKGAATGTKK